MVVIDTSAWWAVVATIDGRHTTLQFIPSRDPALIAELRRIARVRTVTKVAVATGPGSFTGLRKGVSFGLGLAMGLRIPIVPLPTLELQPARSAEPVTAISARGRGPLSYLPPPDHHGLPSP